MDIKKIVFKNPDGSLRKVNIVNSINGIDIPDSGAVILDTVKDITTDGSGLTVTKSDGSTSKVTLNAFGGVKTVNNTQPDSKGNVEIPVGSVKTVNRVKPDSDGNVTIEAGKVKTVNNVQPDISGNVTIDAGKVKTVNNVEPDISGNVTIEAGKVKTVNNVEPDISGNVTIEAGKVKTVNNIQPDDSGNVVLSVVKTVNGNTPDISGNVTIDAGKVKTVDGKAPDTNGNVSLNAIKSINGNTPNANGDFELNAVSDITLSGKNLDIESTNGNTRTLTLPFSDVKTVNNVQPDSNGNITIEAGNVKTVNNIQPDGTLTWGDKNISLLSPVHYSRSSNFETSGRTSIKLPSYLSLMVNGHYFRNDVEVTVDISDTTNWDSTETDYTIADNRAGKDFYIYAVDDKVTKSVHIVLSANSTVPVGYTKSSSRKIGGFHCLCADVGTPTWRNPATLKDEAHWLSGYVKGDILPYSVWDLLHRAESSNEGMMFSPETHMWYDIYLASWDGSKLVSVFGGTTADGASTKKFHGEMFAECAGQINKELISRDEFIVVAKGSNERTAIHGAADADTTGGHVDTANRRMISNIGLEDCCGFLWQWCKQSGGANGSSGFTNSTYNSSVDGSVTYGSTCGNYYRACVGSHWANSSYCGSRCVGVTESSAAVYAHCGGRLSSRERVVTGL